MRWSPFLHVMTMLVGLLAVISAITGWILRDKVVFAGVTGNDLVDKSMLLILIAIWAALGTVIHIEKEGNEED